MGLLEVVDQIEEGGEPPLASHKGLRTGTAHGWTGVYRIAGVSRSTLYRYVSLEGEQRK